MNVAQQEIECEQTDEIVCPHCGEEFSDSWEHLPPPGSSETSIEVFCHDCMASFDVELEYSVTYTSSKKVMA